MLIDGHFVDSTPELNAGTRRAAKFPSIKNFERFAPERDLGDGIGVYPMEMMIKH